MGIYIKGMEKPKSCEVCPLGVEVDTVYETAIGCRVNFMLRSKGNYNNRPEWCPLVPVPPHGRLIDADEFLDRAVGTQCFRGDYALMLEELVGESTTIIEAEGEE